MGNNEKLKDLREDNGIDYENKKSGVRLGKLLITGILIGALSVTMVLIGAGRSFADEPLLTLDDKSELIYYRNKYGTLERILNDIDDNYYEDPKIDEFIKDVVGEYTEYLGDPYLVYGGSDLARYYESRSSGTFKGTGMVLAYKSDGIYVESLKMGTPAAESDIKIGDKIISYGGVSIEDGYIPKFDVGDLVEVEYERDGVKSTVELEYIEGKTSNVYVDEVNGYDYVKLGQFTSGMVDDLKEHGDLKGTGMVLDLRGNTGGDVGEVIKMCEYLGIDTEVELGSSRYDDPIVRSSEGLKKKPRSIVYKSNKDNLGEYAGDIVVLVNNFSASASEMLSEILKEKVGAKVIGEKTYGKGVAQTVLTTPRGGLLMVPISEYKLESGTTIKSDVGVVLSEDVGAVDLDEEYYYSEDVERDDVLKRGLAILKGDGVG